MPTTFFGADVAVRAGLVSALNNPNSSADGKEILDVAVDRVTTFVKSSSSAGSMAQLIQENVGAIQLALKVVIVAYQALSTHMNETAGYRKRFEDELQLKIASFTIPGNVESMKLSWEHQAVAGFLARLNAYPRLLAYSGVKYIVDKEDTRTQHVCALPLYTINQLDHPSASPRDLDQARIAINLFFNSKAVQVMQKVADDFGTDNDAWVLVESLYERKNYLNDLRAPRLILTILLNILWNLQHPVDPETGFSLSLNNSLKLCTQFTELLNNYLADKTPGGPSKINSKSNDLRRIIRHIEIKLGVLYLGFMDEKLRQFNLKDLTNSAHLMLRELDTSLFQLIFTKKDRVTKIEYSDNRAAPDIADSISLLNDLLNKNPGFLKIFDTQRQHIPAPFFENTFVNREAITVIDALIIFCHLTGSQRTEFVKAIEKLPDADEDSALLAGELHIFDKHYIVPLEKKRASRRTTKADPLTAARSLASIVLPLFTLAIADFRIKVETRTSLNRIKETTDAEGTSPYYSGLQQVQLINSAAQEHCTAPLDSARGEYGYHWSISPYLTLTPEAAGSIDSLPSKQYRMTQITELLDLISELTQNYKSFLQYRSFQTFLLDCLEQVDAEYRQFAAEAAQVEVLLSQDGKLDRALKSILLTMTIRLSENLLAFRQSIDEISHIVSAPDFTDLRKQELDKQIRRIEVQFEQLFGKKPVNFTNTYAQILSKVDMTALQIEKEEKIRKLYLFVLDFFTTTKAVLLEAQSSSLPKPPHFLSAIDKGKVAKYIKSIDRSIEHINRLQQDENYLLDSYGLFSQLQLISDEAKGRTSDQVKNSTYCKVILGELNTRLNRQVMPPKPNRQLQPQPLDVSMLSVSGRKTSALFSPPAPSKRAARTNPGLSDGSASAPILTAGEGSLRMVVHLPTPVAGSPPPSTAPSVRSNPDDEREEPLLREFNTLKNELKTVLLLYIASKEDNRSSHWFYHTLDVIKNWLGQFLNIIHVRLRDTKIQVAKKTLGALETTNGEPSARLRLSSSEMNTLSCGVLGTNTFYYRTKVSFWSKLVHTDDASVGSTDSLVSVRGER